MSDNNMITNEPKRIWRQANNPYRSLTFWGWNNEGSPALLFLYGVHEFKEEESFYVDNSDVERFENILEDNVTYTSYIVFSGIEGHLPSFESVNIIDEPGWSDREHKDEYPKMYYKKDSRSDGWYRRLNTDGILNDYIKFEEGCGITIPYFEELSYSELVEKVFGSGVNFENFKFAKNPNEILKISEENKKYFEPLCTIMSNKNLYTRKKKLNELMGSCTNSEIYECIFNLGSTELISGLLLEGAKRNITSFEMQAESILNHTYDAKDYSMYKSYLDGLKRCAQLYINSIKEEKKNEREKWIRENVDKIDLNLIKIDDKKIPEGKILNGAAYRKLSLQDSFREYWVRYERQANGRWESVKTRRDGMYADGPFNDGVTFSITEFKNVLQEAEIYKMADVIGKIAYYIDAPRLHYYFKGNSLSRPLNYFKRYLRRIIEDYGKNDPDRFMEVMKVLLTSYTEHDFLCKFKGNFQFNYFIKNILYYDFKEKPPIGWDNWRERDEWMRNDQLLKLQGRHEFMKEVWDNHLEDVLYIACNAKVNTILKACYFILKESDKTDDLISEMTYEKLVNLSVSGYEPLAEMFMEALENKLNSEEKFDFSIMCALMNTENEKVISMAMDYFKRTNGHIQPDNIVDLFFLNNVEKWTEYIVKNINEINPSDYIEFIKAMSERSDKFDEYSVEPVKEITDALSESVNKINELDIDGKKEILSYTVNVVLEKGHMKKFLEKYMEEVIFALSYSEIQSFMESEEFQNIREFMDCRFNKKSTQSVGLSVRNNMILNTMYSIYKNSIPYDSSIIGILENGTSKLIKTLFEIINVNEEELKGRFSTMLLFFESEVIMLNKKAQEIFSEMNGKSKEDMHRVIIDSPIEKVYEYGLKKLKEIYGEFVPKEFIMAMMQHTSPKVKAYISNKSESILKTLGEGNEDLFIYYAKTLLLLPNKVRKNKDDIFDALYDFSIKYLTCALI